VSKLTIKNKNNNFLKSLRRITEKTDELKQMQQDLESMYTNLDYHMKEIHLITKKWMDGQTEPINKTVENKNVEVEKFEQKIEQLKTGLKEQFNETISKNEELKTVNDEVEKNKAREELTLSQLELQRQLQQVNKIQAELQLKQEELELERNNSEQHNEDVSLLKKQVDELNNEVEAEEQLFSTFEESLNDIKTQLDNNPDQFLRANRLVNALQDKLQQKQEELDAANANITAKSEIITKISSNRSIYTSEPEDNYKEKYYDLKKQFDQLVSENSEYKTTMGKTFFNEKSEEHYDSKYHDLKMQFDKLSKEHDELLKLAVTKLTDEK